jgi:hypothetical protein
MGGTPRTVRTGVDGQLDAALVCAFRRLHDYYSETNYFAVEQ